MVQTFGGQALRSFRGSMLERGSDPSFSSPSEANFTRRVETIIRRDPSAPEIKRKVGAGNGIRTRDFNLGKVTLYH